MRQLLLSNYFVGILKGRAYAKFEEYNTWTLRRVVKYYMQRNSSVDLLKAMAIVSVILLHSLPQNILFSSLAPFHIWQAVPVFIMLAGYNNANSYSRRGNLGYEPRLLLARLERLLIPYLFVWVLEVVLYVSFKGNLGLVELLKSLVTGGWGPGTYFIPIALQLTFIAPLFYRLAITRGLGAMLAVGFISDMLLELALFPLGLSPALYRVLIIRYIFALSLGIWLAMAKNKPKALLAVGAIISFVYIAAVNYSSFTLPIEQSWKSQTAPSFLWPLILIMIGFKVFAKVPNTWPWIICSKIGIASYHIFLVQMAYFWLRGNIPLIKDLSGIPMLIASLIICIMAGLAFNAFESKLRKTLTLRLNKQITKTV
jgi:surface polysaccharide O-acyltransferase-like enzyme